MTGCQDGHIRIHVVLFKKCLTSVHVQTAYHHQSVSASLCLVKISNTNKGEWRGEEVLDSLDIHGETKQFERKFVGMVVHHDILCP